jgi:hypothetical protein
VLQVQMVGCWTVLVAVACSGWGIGGAFAFVGPCGRSCSSTSSRPITVSLLRMGAQEEDFTKDLQGKRLAVQFAAWGFTNQQCELTLQTSGDARFGEGLATSGPGSWRVEDEDGKTYLQFTSPLTPDYSAIFGIPCGIMYWRAELQRSGQGEGLIAIEDGFIISERSQGEESQGADQQANDDNADFIAEGTFRATILGKNELLPKLKRLDAVAIIDGDEGPESWITEDLTRKNAKDGSEIGLGRRRK